MSWARQKGGGRARKGARRLISRPRASKRRRRCSRPRRPTLTAAQVRLITAQCTLTCTMPVGNRMPTAMACVVVLVGSIEGINCILWCD